MPPRRSTRARAAPAPNGAPAAKPAKPAGTRKSAKRKAPLIDLTTLDDDEPLKLAAKPPCQIPSFVPSSDLPRDGSSIHPDAFPHLFDAFLEDQSVETLLAVRSASRSLRERVDAELATHLVLKIKTHGSDKIHVVPRKFEEQIAFSALEGTWGDLEHWSGYLDRTRVLDLCGGVTPFIPPSIKEQFTRLRTVRVRGTPHDKACYSGFAAKTFIVHAGPYWKYSGVERPIPVPRGTTRIVYSFTHRPSEGVPPIEAFVRQYAIPETVSEVVILVDKKVEKKKRRRNPEWGDMDEPEEYDLSSINRIYDILAHEGVKAILVDIVQWVDTANPAESFTSLPGITRIEVCEEKVITAMKREGREAGNVFTFMSRDRYRSLVGPDRFAEETGT